jgi:hypothetical protein
MTYNEAYNKIIDAYFKNEIKPYKAKFCFCGTLCDKSDAWHGVTGFTIFQSAHNDYNGYAGDDFVRMETALLESIRGVRRLSDAYEDALFAGMCAALEELKAIHKSRGENVDELPKLTKRQLV